MAPIPKRVFHAFLAASLTFGLAACGQDSAPEAIAKAAKEANGGQVAAAIVRLKSALQKEPESGALRAALGKWLLASGDPVAALVELEKAREYKWTADEVLPALVEALVATGQSGKALERFASASLDAKVPQARLKQGLAAAYLATGRVDDARASLEAALAADPKNAPARLMRVRMVAGRGQFDDAISMVDALLADQPALVEARQLKAELLWVGKSDPAAAIKLLNETLQMQPGYLPAHSTLLTLLVQTNDVARFKVALDALKKAHPNSPVALFFETQWHLAQRDIRNARDSAQQLLKLAPQHALSLQLVGAVEAEDGAIQAAESHLSKALQLSPGLVPARQVLGQLYLRAGQADKALTVVQPLLSKGGADAKTHGVAAEAFVQKGDIDRAEQHFAAAAKASPDDVKARTALAIAQFYKGRVESGFAQLESAAAADKASAYADLALISARLRRNETAEAMAVADRLIAKLPNQALPHAMRGQILLARKDAAGARSSFEKALSVDPSYFPAVSALASQDLAEGKAEAAQKRFEAVIARDAKHVQARLALAGLKQRGGAKPDDVVALLRDAVGADPADPSARLAMVDYLLSQRRGEAALTAARDAAAALPERPELIDALGRAQLASGDAQQALNSFSKVALLMPQSALPQLRLADGYLVNRDTTSAKTHLRKALDIDPKTVAARRKLIQLALAERKTDEALKLARDAQQRLPNDPSGYQLEAQINAAVKAWDAAIVASQSALDRSGGDSGIAQDHHALLVAAGRGSQAEAFAASWMAKRPKDIDFVRYLGSAALLRNDFAAAEVLLRRILEDRADDVLVLNNLAWSLAKQRKAGAVATATKALELSPGNPLFLDTLAIAYASEENWKKAIQAQEAAISMAPEQHALKLSLCRLLIASGNKERARAELDSLSKLGTKFSNQAEVENLKRLL